MSEADKPFRLTVRLLLACGLLSSLLYVVSDVVGALSYPAYDYRAQAISEMSAIGAPTTDLLAPFYMIFSVLFSAFAAGVWLTAAERPKKRQHFRRSAAFLIAMAALGIGWALFPMNMRGAERTLSDTMHLVLSGVTMLLLSGAMLHGGRALGHKFRFYSLATILVMLTFFVFTLRDAPRLDAGLPTPLMGLKERISMAAWLLWIAVFSGRLWREGGRSRMGVGNPGRARVPEHLGARSVEASSRTPPPAIGAHANHGGSSE